MGSGARVNPDTARHEKASHDYGATGSTILELAKNAHNLFVLQDSHDQARLLKMLVSSCRFDRGSPSVSYIKPFHLLVGNENGIGWEAGILRAGFGDRSEIWPVSAQLAGPLRLLCPTRLPGTFASLPAFTVFASAMTPKMTVSRSLSRDDFG